MFKLIGFDHIVLKTDQVDAMLHFYCDILGCKIEKKNIKYSITHLRAGKHMIDLIQIEQGLKSTEPNVDHFCLRISGFDYDFLNKYFSEHDIEILEQGERYGAFGVGKSIYIKDPQGNVVELKEDKEA